MCLSSDRARVKSQQRSRVAGTPNQLLKTPLSWSALAESAKAEVVQVLVARSISLL